MFHYFFFFSYLRIYNEGEPWSWLYDLLHGAPHLPRHEAEDCKDDQAREDANRDIFKYSFLLEIIFQMILIQIFLLFNLVLILHSKICCIDL